MRFLPDKSMPEINPEVPLGLMRDMADVIQRNTYDPGALVSSTVWSCEIGRVAWMGIPLGDVDGLTAVLKAHTPARLLASTEFTLDYCEDPNIRTERLYLLRGLDEAVGIEEIRQYDVDFLHGIHGAVQERYK